MIHVLKAPVYACQALGAATSSCTSACDDALCGCGAPSSALANIFAEMVTRAVAAAVGLCQVLVGVLRIDGPLGGLVLLALVMNVPSAILAMQAASDPQVAACTAAPLQAFCVLDAGLALGHLFFASYFKRRLDSELDACAAAAAAAPGAAPEVRLVATQVWQQVRTLALYDAGVAVYFFVFCLSLYGNTKGLGMVRSCRLRSELASNAAGLQLLYAFLMLQYLFCWSLVHSCLDRFRFVRRLVDGPWSTTVPRPAVVDPLLWVDTAAPASAPRAHPPLVRAVQGCTGACGACSSCLVRWGWKRLHRAAQGDGAEASYHAFPPRGATAPRPSVPLPSAPPPQ
mmetsp:Transcript_4572/g.11091  ORF Transcript_4572/g.11091 Transcript_4572/m.11091 type:complete len:342 (+) Transcript_4572:71-1096(+)